MDRRAAWREAAGGTRAENGLSYSSPQSTKEVRSKPKTDFSQKPFDPRVALTPDPPAQLGCPRSLAFGDRGLNASVG